MTLKSVLFVSILLFVTSCATAPNSLPTQIQQKIKSTDVILFVYQDELEILETGSGCSGGGNGVIAIACLTALVVGTAIHYKAKSKLISINESLQNYDFRTVMLNALSAEFPKLVNIKLNSPIRFEKKIPIKQTAINLRKLERLKKDTSQKQMLFTQSKTDSVLFMDISYHLGMLEKLVITANLEMYSKSQNLLKQAKEKMNNANPINSWLKSVNMKSPTDNDKIYKKTFTFNSAESITPDNAKDTLNEGANNIAKMIVADINNPL